MKFDINKAKILLNSSGEAYSTIHTGVGEIVLWNRPKIGEKIWGIIPTHIVLGQWALTELFCNSGNIKWRFQSSEKVKATTS